jgi:hypothetical protein
LAGFRAPAWSQDGRYVYFLSDFSRTASGLCRFDTMTGSAAFLAPVTQFRVLRAGRWRGLPVADLAEGDARPYFVLLADGGKERVGEAGEQIEAVVARAER